MKKAPLFLSLCLLLHASFAQRSLKTLVKETENAVFLVSCFDANNQLISTGSGFFFDRSGLAYTNVHVIKSAHHATIKTIDNKTYNVANVIDYNPTLDIAKIQVLNPNRIAFPTIKIASKDSEKGDEIFTIGNPDGLESSISTGIVSSIRKVPDYGDCYQVTASISPGSSGGALLNMNGEVIGITSFGRIDASRLNQNLNFATNINNAKFLTRHLNLSVAKVSEAILSETFTPSYMQAQLAGDFQSAIKICTDQLSLNPSNGLAYHLRATTYLAAGEMSMAEKDFNSSLLYSKSPNVRVWDYIGLGKIYRKSGQFPKARDNYLKALEIDSANARVYCNLAILAADWLGKDNQLVEPSYRRALQLDPTSCSFGYKTMAEKMLEEKQYDKAIPVFKMSIATESDEFFSVNEYYNLGTCCYQIRNYDSAIEAFKTCIRLMPSDAQSYHWIGLCYIQLGRKTDACAALNKALEVNNAFSKDADESSQLQSAINTNCR
jgi:tetratricopeptide (TPR) repeat protein